MRRGSILVRRARSVTATLSLAWICGASSGAAADAPPPLRFDGEPSIEVGLIWDADTLNYRRIQFPHLASWLPDEDERAQLCFEFAQEVERIQLLMAA